MEKSKNRQYSDSRCPSISSPCVQLTEPKAAISILGTGLLALDIVIDSDSQHSSRLWAGGTLGNVLIILSYLGWRAYPVARLNGDTASKLVLRDLKRWGVQLDFIRQKPTADTPIIVHLISRNRDGQPYHKYSWICPHCGAWLPTYKPVTDAAARQIAETIDQPQVFFFDRVSRSALTLAESCARKGALIVFEPSANGDVKLLPEAFAIAHIVKYASDRTGLFSQYLSGSNPLIEIETLGREGLRYRCRLDNHKTREWQTLAAYPISNLKDAAGSGDWCTAGLLHCIGQRGLAGLKGLTDTKLRAALRLGQAMATWNCGFEGARGGMYMVDKTTFQYAINQILSDTNVRLIISSPIRSPRQRVNTNICPACWQR
jgi:sugar/nucleoside kinase (ribokinase family)